MFPQVLACRPQLLIVSTERAATITGDVARGVEAGSLIAHVLHDWQSHQCLGTGNKNSAIGNRVLIFERDVTQSHPVLPFAC